ncbi:MAG: hypothetical protein RLZZ244_2708, partial [Verrucomicrobiota bacterium]
MSPPLLPRLRSGRFPLAALCALT